MQSKTAFVLLGILKERERNPYEIVKILDKLNISRWSPISSSSVYMTMRTLEKKGLIEGRKEKSSAMPEKTVYHITASGSAAFMGALKSYMSDDVTDITRFNLSTLFMCHLSKEEVLKTLTERQNQLIYHFEKTEEAFLRYKTVEHVPEFALISLRHNINFFKSELVSTEEMLGIIQGATTWNVFPTSETFQPDRDKVVRK